AWASVTRALRTPSRVDRDLYAPSTPPYLLSGGPNFVSEKVIAYEVGYRVHPVSNLFIELAMFYNIYDDLRSVEPPLPYTISNGLEGVTSGLELFVNYQATNWWRLKPGLSYLNRQIRLKYRSADLNNGNAEGNDAPFRFHLQSQMDLPAGIEFDASFRFVDELPLRTAQAPAYAELTLRLGYSFTEHLSASIVGQNLLHNEHLEYRYSSTGGQIPRSVYGKFMVSY
ncbi:MAG: TonB-dependent receptor, partial [Bacteroidetes bacterium]